jgi:hypothetical protein
MQRQNRKGVKGAQRLWLKAYSSWEKKQEEII